MRTKLFKNILKSGALIALSLSMAIPASIMPASVYADEAILIQSYDFEKGFREFYDEDPNYSLLSSGGLFVKKVGGQIEEGSDRVDANGFVIMGQGTDARYHTQQVANQPSTKYDEERGTVIVLCDTYNVPELVKELPAKVATDEIGSETLDAAVPVGTVVREAATYKSAMTFTNPYTKLTSEGAVLGFWGKVPADTTEEKLAFIEFSSADTAVSFAYDASVARGEWHYYTYVIGKDSITTYVDGAVSEAAPVVDGTAPADYIEFLKTATIYFGATNTSSVVTAEETVFDNVVFYDGAMTVEEVTALYNTEYEDASRKADIAAPVKLYTMDSEEQFTNLDAEKVGVIENFNINGHEVKGVAVPENSKVTTKAGIKLNENPFAGMRLEGATVGYWIQVEPTAKKQDSGVIDNTVALAFIDGVKYVYNPKESDKSKDAFSYLYTKSGMYVQFMEGGYSDIAIGNSYTATCDEEVVDKYVEESSEWHYITLSINNDRITIYRDGEKVDTNLVNRGARFFDGYYRRIGEREKEYTLYGVFGGSGNQRATTIMSYLAYEDTIMNFGFLPTSDFLTERSSPMNITRISCYDISMDDDEVMALYEQETATINAMPEYQEPVTFTPGDLDEDGDVSALDALIILKISARMMDSTDWYTMVGDLNSDGKLDAQDALQVLKIAAKLV